MEVYRITQAEFAKDLSGNGARMYGGRWNSEGQFAVYTTSSRALALLETLVHTPLHLLRHKKYSVLTISIPKEATTETIELKKLPVNWDAWDLQFYTQRLGNMFLKENKKLLLQVPSVLVPEEINFVLNPLHPLMQEVKITHKRELKFNDRLFRAM